MSIPHQAAAPGQAALAAGRHSPNLVILDLRERGLDSADVVACLQRWTHAPVIVLTGPRAHSYHAGSSRAGRAPARLRLVGPPSAVDRGPAPVRIGNVVVDLAAKRVTRRGQESAGGPDGDIRLTPTEWRLLEVLLRSPGQLLGQQQLLAQVWGPGYARAAGNLRLYMTQLRRKLEPDPARPRWLITERGMGYRFHPAQPGLT
jgi:two-component system, OmpR family, KDP operon response regulator KdpE